MYHSAQLLHLNLTDCLEDFHPWLSVYSRPSYSTHSHTQRLSVCLLLLQAYMCANSILIYIQEDQVNTYTKLLPVKWCRIPVFKIKLYSILTLLCVFMMSVLVGIGPDRCFTTFSVDRTVWTYSAAFRLSCVLPLPYQRGQKEFVHIFQLKWCTAVEWMLINVMNKDYEKHPENIAVV